MSFFQQIFEARIIFILGFSPFISICFEFEFLVLVILLFILCFCFLLRESFTLFRLWLIN